MLNGLRAIPELVRAAFMVLAGGLGQMLCVSLSVFKTHEAATLTLAMVLIVTLVDALSAWLRRVPGRSGG